MKLSNVNLEMSLKPFVDSSDATMEAVLAKLFRQWAPLIARADAVSVMLWAADGSEILDYAADLDAKFEWCNTIGVANPRWSHTSKSDPNGDSTHQKPVLYMENPPEFTYAWLKTLVARIKSWPLGKPITVVETFDPGPEFAKSTFKYERHKEICAGQSIGRDSFVCCYATLHADSREYAAYPDGIPEGESFGRFLGKQSQAFLSDLGFDALWLSNGFGFGLETWSYTGALFDGKSFSNAKAPETREKVLKFWRDFTTECSFPLQTRGSNFPSGVDVASDAVPIREIYREYKPLPPPNSPWAALDGDFGIELGGWMSHIAEVPDDKSYQFRYYIHDPWFKNSPWLDRYHRESHDIFLPLAISRINAKGEVAVADHLSFLTVDDSFGQMPDKVPLEVIPKLLEAFDDAPDAPGPLVWVYPFDEIHDMVAAGRGLDVIFFGDWFICGAINHGLPLNTVVSTANFVRNPGVCASSIVVAPCGTLSDAAAEALVSFVKGGGRVMFYGPVTGAPAAVRDLLGIEAAAPLSGKFIMECALATGAPEEFVHDPLVSGGGLAAVASTARVLAIARRGDESRVVASSRTVGAGKVVWVRGGASGKAGEGGHHLTPFDPAVNFNQERLPGLLLSEFGWDIRFDKRSWGARCPITMIARHDNALYFSGFTPDLTAGLKLKTPLGAPLFTGYETILRDGFASYRMPRSWHEECRVFVEQAEGFVFCAEATAEQMRQRRHIRVSGLKDATLRFLHERGKADKASFLHDPQWPFLGGDYLEAKQVSGPDGDYLEVSGVTGELLIQLLAYVPPHNV